MIYLGIFYEDLYDIFGQTVLWTLDFVFLGAVVQDELVQHQRYDVFEVIEIILIFLPFFFLFEELHDLLMELFGSVHAILYVVLHQ